MSSFKMVIFFFLYTYFLNLGCGSSTVASRSIDEKQSEKPYAANYKASPFHSYSGWQRAIEFYVEQKSSNQVLEAARDAANIWNDAVGRDVMTFAGSISSTRGESLYASLEDDFTVLYPVDNWIVSTGKTSTTLATTIWQNALDSDQIIKGDVLLNTEEYSFVDSMKATTSVVQGKTVVDSETVLLHEFGHLMGLEHTDVVADMDSIMHAKTFIGAKVTARVPSVMDVENLKSLYE